MKKQASDQQFHDRRHQERKRVEAAKKFAPKKKTAETSQSTNGPAKEAASESLKPSL